MSDSFASGEKIKAREVRLVGDNVEMGVDKDLTAAHRSDFLRWWIFSNSIFCDDFF